MRLIDVDNFLKRFSYQVPGDTIDAIYLRLALLYEPKVEAIPVEWIKNWISSEPLGINSLIAPEYTIEAMLYWWEKENETS